MRRLHRQRIAGRDWIGARLVGESATSPELVVRSAHRSRGRLVLEFEGVNTVEQAEALVGANVRVARVALNLAEGEYLDDDLVGLKLFDETGQALGEVSAVKHYPAQDCLVLEPGAALVPMVREFIRDVDIPGRRMVVRLPVGLIDDGLAEQA